MAGKTGTCDEADSTPTYNHDSSNRNPPPDADLQRLMDAWPRLDELTKAIILTVAGEKTP